MRVPLVPPMPLPSLAVGAPPSAAGLADAAPPAALGELAGIAVQAGIPLAQPTSIDLAPARYAHPNAEREISLGEHRVGYALRRTRRRSIGFVVGVEGLTVSAPNWMGVRDIDAALREKTIWLLNKLHEQQARAVRLQSARIEWRDGVAIPFLGQHVTVVLDPRAGATPSSAVLDAGADTAGPRRLHLGLPHSATPNQIRDAVQSWLQRQAKRVFAERCEHYAAQLGVRYARLSLSSAQTRWGSASADGSIRLSWRLIHFGMSAIDYVVAHELAHLREMNHSPRFWDVVRSVLPDYETTRRTLKTDALPVFD